jgi:hypothetical protein
MKSIAANYMPEVVSDFPYDFKKMLESCPQELGWAFRASSSQVQLIISPKQRAKPAASRTRTCTNAAVCIASGECSSWF